MEPRDLNRMFDALAPTADQEQAVLDRLLQTERKGRPIRKLKKLTVVAIAAALMVISCAAAVVTGLDQRLIDYFGAGPEQAELLAFGAVPVDVTVKDNGATLHVTQGLMDRYYIMFLADFTAPEGTVLDGDRYFFDTSEGFKDKLLDRSGEPIEIEGGWSFGPEVLDDGDPMDNHLSLLFRLTLDEGVQPDWEIGGISMYNGDLMRHGENPWDIITVWSGDWSCEVPFTWQDIGRSIQPNQVIGQLDGRDITLTDIYLSPLTLRIRYQRYPLGVYPPHTRTQPIDYRWNHVLESDNITLTTREGRTVDLIVEGYAGTSNFWDHRDIYHLAEITALEDLEGGTLNIRIEGGSVDVPLDGLVPAESVK